MYGFTSFTEISALTFNFSLSSNVFLVTNLLFFLSVVRRVRVNLHIHQSDALNRVSSKAMMFLACRPHFVGLHRELSYQHQLHFKLFNVYSVIRCNFSICVPPLFSRLAHRLNWRTDVTLLNWCWTALNSRWLFHDKINYLLQEPSLLFNSRMMKTTLDDHSRPSQKLAP